MDKAKVVAALLLVIAFPAKAEKNTLELPLSEVLGSESHADQAGDVAMKFYFGRQWMLLENYEPRGGGFGRSKGREVAIKGTNTKMHDSKPEACRKVMRSLVADARRRAQGLGANAVFFLANYPGHDPRRMRSEAERERRRHVSDTTYLCKSGFMNTTVTYELMFARLKGETRPRE